MAWRGVWAGFSVYALVVAALYLTPLRLPVVQAAGSDHAAFQIRLAQQRDLVVTLQRQAELPTATAELRASLERARHDHEVLQSRLQSWQRLHAGISPFGFMAWFSDLWPWLLSFGVALPVLGGLIGAQARRGRRERPAATFAEEASGRSAPQSVRATEHETLMEELDKEYPPLEEGERPQMSLFDAAPGKAAAEALPPPVSSPPPPSVPAATPPPAPAPSSFAVPPPSGPAPAEAPPSPPPPPQPSRPRTLEEELLETWKAPVARPSVPRRKSAPVKSPHVDP